MNRSAKCLAHRTALVTGSSRKLGAAIALELAQHGADVVVTYKDSREAALDVVASIEREGRSAIALYADMSNEHSVLELVSAALDHFGSIEILINNAGPYTATPLAQLDSGGWDWIMDANVRGAFLASQAVAASMLAQGWGRIVNISAGSAFVRNHSVYGLAKNALLFLTGALALEYAPLVTVNAIAPGLIDDPDLTPEFKEPFRLATPLRRLVTFQEVAHMTIALCSPLFGTVTGQVIAMDAGRSLPREEPPAAADQTAAS